MSKRNLNYKINFTVVCDKNDQEILSMFKEVIIEKLLDQIANFRGGVF